MPVEITKIQAQVKSKGRYSVFIDNKFAFGISELALINSGLRAGQRLNAEEVESLKHESDIDKLYHRALELIVRRPRSRWEINDYLRRKKVDSDTAAEIISRLEAKDYIDDLNFSRSWITNRRLLKPTSRRKLYMELKQKRVDEEYIRQALEEDEVSDREVLAQEIDKKRRQSRYQDNNKLMQYLARQGYGYEDIKDALADNG